MEKAASIAVRGGEYLLAPFSLALLLVAYWPVCLVVRTRRSFQH
jgi:hypothetical protein